MLKNLAILFTSLQGRYAKALFTEGNRVGCLETINENFDKLSELFLTNRHLEELLSSSTWNRNTSAELWETIGKKLSFCPTFLNFVKVVADNARLGLINKIKYIYNIAYEHYKNTQSIVIYSAVKLNIMQKKKLEKLVAKIFPENATIRYEIDENLLGGLKISLNGVVIDASVATQVRQLESFARI